TVRNSKFYGNSIYDIFVQDNSGPIDTITLENNWFAAPVGTTGQVNGTTVAFSTVPQNVAIRQNSFNAQMSLDDNGTNPTYVGWVIERNVGPLPYGACSLKGIVFRSNAWTNGACGSTDVNLNGPAPYVNPSNDASADYHLTGGPAVALGAGGNPSSGGVGGSPTAGNPAGGPAAAGPVGGGAVRRKAPRKASLAASKRSINVSRRGSFSFGFRASAGLRGRVAFKRATKVRVGATRKTVTLVRKSYTVPSSTKVKLAFKLSRRNLRILRTKRKLKTTVVVTLTNAAGLSSTARATIMLKR
ncbi:MAG: hypothetical protein JWO02_4204, partial [Solirubrobacterales bacterium]|nr:hypothetical protein [Solirubrobacterales bacterium]